MSRVVTLSKTRAARSWSLEELLRAFDGARAECDARLGVEGVLDVGMEDVGDDGLVRVPVEEVGEEDEAGHGKEFLVGGRGSC